MLHEGYSVDKIQEISRIDKWFLYKLENIVEMYKKLQNVGSLCAGTFINHS
jgi:carbamoyl-phosphate synthase large subunit